MTKSSKRDPTKGCTAQHKSQPPLLAAAELLNSATLVATKMRGRELPGHATEAHTEAEASAFAAAGRPKAFPVSTLQQMAAEIAQMRHMINPSILR